MTLHHYSRAQAWSRPTQTPHSHSLGDESVVEDGLVSGTELNSSDPGAASQSTVHVSLPQSPLVLPRGGGAFNIVWGTAWNQMSMETQIATTGSCYVILFVLRAVLIFTSLLFLSCLSLCLQSWRFPGKQKFEVNYQHKEGYFCQGPIVKHWILLL